MTRRGRPLNTGYFAKRPEVADAVQAILSSQHRSAPQILELLRVSFPEPPTLWTLQRYIRQFESENVAVLASMRDPDKFKSQYRIALGRADEKYDSAHQAWELDTSPADVHTTAGRVAILGCIDIFSRQAYFMVDRSESGLSVRRLLIEAIRHFGALPQAVVTDNGSGYVNQSVTSALQLLGIDQRLCTPGKPEQKPHVERVFQSLQHERLEMLDGFAGHNVAEAQRLRAAAKKQTGRAVIKASVTPEELQAVIHAWTEGTYHQSVHAGISMTPLAKAATSARPARRAPAEDTLRIALSDRIGVKTVTKKGLRHHRETYWHAALAGLVGQQVVIRRDEAELGELMVFDHRDRFICTAVNPLHLGISSEDVAAAARAQQQAVLNAGRAQLREKQRRFRISDARDAMLRQEAERAGKLTRLPVGTERHTTPTLHSIENQPSSPPPPSRDELERARAAFARPVPATKPRDVNQKIADADRIIAAADRGEEVDAAALRLARLYASGSEYRAAKTLRAAFPTRAPESASIHTFKSGVSS